MRVAYGCGPVVQCAFGFVDDVVQIVAMMKVYVEKSHCHGDDVVTRLGCLSDQLELTTTAEEIDNVSDLLSDFAQLQIDRIHQVPR